MADNIFIGGATNAVMVKTATPGGTIEAGDKFIIVLDDTNGNSETLSVDATGTTVESVCDDILTAVTALAATSLFKTLVTVSDTTTHVTFTAATAGVPFELTLSTTESNDDPADAQTFTEATTTARSGAYDYGTPANWSTGAIPVADDVVYISPTAGDILYGLDQSGVELDGFYRPLAHQGDIGDGTNYLYIDVENGKPIEIDYHYGPTISAPTRRTMIHVKDAPITTVHNVPTSVTGETGKPPTRFLFGSASAVLHVLGGTGQVGVAVNVAAETSTIGTVHVASSSASVWIGAGVTITTLSLVAGTVVCQAAPTTIVNDGATLTLNTSGTVTNFTNNNGTVTTAGTVAFTNFTVKGGTVYSNASGTITTGALEGGTLDFTKSRTARTVTALQTTLHGVYGPAVLMVDDSVVTLTAKWEPVGRTRIATAA